MALQFVPSFIRDRIADSAQREILQMCQRILEVAESPNGIRCYTQQHLRIETAIPIETLRESKKHKLVNFCSEELMRRLEELGEKRISGLGRF
jgi:hypothetical protein